MSRENNCTAAHQLAQGKLGGAGTPGGGVIWFRVLADPCWGRGLWRLETATPTHIHRDPLHNPGVGTVGPLRSRDSPASHLIGCTLVPVDSWLEKEPGGTGATVSEGLTGMG